MKTQHFRHIDQGIHLLDFQRRDQLVYCPKCQKAGILYCQSDTPIDERTYSTAIRYVFTCTACGTHLDTTNERYHQHLNQQHKVCISGRCSHCGGQWLHTCKTLKDPHYLPDGLTLSCDICQHTTYFSVNAKDVHSMSIERYGYTAFGLKLYLHQATRFGEIFVYNSHHLAVLKAFVQADLRERTAKTSNRSYFSRLPTWIKSARNRKEILKAILRLEAMATTMSA